MNYLILGGEFNNKGAEAMTLVAIDSIIRNDPEAFIFIRDRSVCPYRFVDQVRLFKCSDRMLHLLSGISMNCVDWMKEFVKYIVPGRDSIFKHKRATEELLKSIDITIDISGYKLASKWPDTYSIEYCEWISVMKSYGSRVYLMPQSFGPFEYKSASMISMIKIELSKCDRIFAREKKGYDDLISLGLTNIDRCYDSVLIDRDFHPERVIQEFDKHFEEIPVTKENNIAIVPNYRLIDRGGLVLNDLIDFYCKIIEANPSYSFYLTAHAGEDLAICNAVKERFLNNDNIHLIDHVMLSFNYENFAKKMDFIIASRYHSIVHAYKECTPAVILGWADKYEDVAQLFNQKRYIVEINDVQGALQTISQMCVNCDTEREIIQQRLIEAQKYNCYSFLELHNDRGDI